MKPKYIIQMMGKKWVISVLSIKAILLQTLRRGAVKTLCQIYAQVNKLCVSFFMMKGIILPRLF